MQLGPTHLPTTRTAAPEVHPLKEMNGKVQLNHLDGFTSQNEPLFKQTTLRTEGKGVYACQRGDWPIGQLFQLAAQAEQQGLYVYAFSVDAQQQTHVHWPRVGTFNEKFKGMNESALLLNPKTRVLIPGKDKALRLNEKGTDVLYLLFASQPVKHLDFIIAKMTEATDHPRERLEAVLGSHLIPISDVTFESGQASFAAHTRSKGYIVPLIVTVSTD